MSYFPGNKFVKELSSKDFNPSELTHLQNPAMCLMGVLYYAPWCPHCKDAAPIWEAAAKGNAFSKLCAVNIEAPENKEMMMSIKETTPHFVQSYPTIWYFVGGKPVEKFDSGKRKRSKEAIMDDLQRLKVECSK
jgi:thiol-disulfide isomerase/thioredoxin